jgi:hypothetical protein
MAPLAGGVPGRADDLPVGVAEPEDLPVVEHHPQRLGCGRGEVGARGKGRSSTMRFMTMVEVS